MPVYLNWGAISSAVRLTAFARLTIQIYTPVLIFKYLVNLSNSSIWFSNLFFLFMLVLIRILFSKNPCCHAMIMRRDICKLWLSPQDCLKHGYHDPGQPIGLTENDVWCISWVVNKWPKIVPIQSKQITTFLCTFLPKFENFILNSSCSTSQGLRKPHTWCIDKVVTKQCFIGTKEFVNNVTNHTYDTKISSSWTDINIYLCFHIG